MSVAKTGIMIFMLITAIIGTICLIINFVCILDFKWHIDYFISKDAVCNKLRWTAFEIESIRYNFAAFLNGDKFKFIKDDFVATYSIVTAVLGGLILSTVLLIITIETSDNKRLFYILILLLITPMLIIFITVTGKFMTNFEDIKKDEDLNAYFNVYKIVSAVMVLSGMKDVELKYALEGLGKDTLDNILEKNIASYEDVYISSKVKEIKQNAYDKLDFLKYLVFDKYSPYYLPYFDNIYMRHKMAENRFLEDLYLKYDKYKLKPIDYIYNISEWIKLYDYNYLRDKFPNESDDDMLVFVNANKDDKDLYAKTIKELAEKTTYQTLVNELKIINDFVKQIQELSTADTSFENIYKNYNSMKQFLYEMKTSLTSLTSLESKESDLYTYAKQQFDRTDVKTMNEYVKLNMEIHSMLENSGTKLEKIADYDYIKYYIDHKDILTTPKKLDTIFQKIKEQSNYAYMYYVYLSIIFLLVLHYIFNITDRATYIYILGAILITYILFMWVYTQLSFLG
jgi:hypothetical protein